MKSKCVDLELFGDSGYIVTLVSQVNNTKCTNIKQILSYIICYINIIVILIYII